MKTSFEEGSSGAPLLPLRGRQDPCSVDCSVTSHSCLIVLGSGEFGGQVNASGVLVKLLQQFQNSIIGPDYPTQKKRGGGPSGVVSTKCR